MDAMMLKKKDDEERPGNQFPKKNLMEFRIARTAEETRACMWQALGEAGRGWFASRSMPPFPEWQISQTGKSGDRPYAGWIIGEIGLRDIIRFANGGGSAEEAAKAIKIFEISYPHAGTSAKHMIQESYALAALSLACFRFMDSERPDGAELAFNAANSIRSKELDPCHMTVAEEMIRAVPSEFFASAKPPAPAKA